MTVAPIRTFHPRRGRVTAAQADALERLWPAYGVDVDGTPLDLRALFGRAAPVVLEIGFGMGEATAEMAAAEPGCDILAVDVHTPGQGSLLRRIEDAGLTNVRVGNGDALELLRHMLGPGSLHGVRAFFPDPWPKTRHVKRRLVTTAFCDLAAERMAPGGLVHVATDWPAYAEQARRVLAEHPRFAAAGAPWRPRTRFEEQGRAAGRPAYDVAARLLPQG